MAKLTGVSLLHKRYNLADWAGKSVKQGEIVVVLDKKIVYLATADIASMTKDTNGLTSTGLVRLDNVATDLSGYYTKSEIDTIVGELESTWTNELSELGNTRILPIEQWKQELETEAEATSEESDYFSVTVKTQDGKVTNVVVDDSFGTMAKETAVDYVKKADAPGYDDIWTKKNQNDFVDQNEALKSGITAEKVRNYDVVVSDYVTEAEAKTLAANEINSIIGGVSSTDTIENIKTLVEYVNTNGSNTTAILTELYGASADPTKDSRIDALETGLGNVKTGVEKVTLVNGENDVVVVTVKANDGSEKSGSVLVGYAERAGTATDSLALEGHAAEYFATAKSVSDLSQGLDNGNIKVHSAGYADDATNAGHADNADYATNAGHAVTAGTADEADNSNKLGGQEPSYYATATSISTLRDDLGSGTLVVGKAADANYLGGQTPSYYATASALAGVKQTAEGKQDPMSGASGQITVTNNVIGLAEVTNTSVNEASVSNMFGAVSIDKYGRVVGYVAIDTFDGNA